MSILNDFSTAFHYLLALLVFACWLFIVVKMVKNKFASVKTAEAMVVDKYKTQTVSRIPETFKRERCIIVFSAGEKKLAFDVSEFSFQGYKIGEKGTLRYKGNKIIDFI